MLANLGLEEASGFIPFASKLSYPVARLWRIPKTGKMELPASESRAYRTRDNSGRPALEFGTLVITPDNRRRADHVDGVWLK